MLRKLIKRFMPLWAVRLYLRLRYGGPRLIYRSYIPPQICIKKNTYKGKRCFIIGGGPSINQMDLSPLNTEYCIAVNRGFLLQEHGLDHVEFYGLSDISAYTEYGQMIPSNFAKNICIFGEIPWDRSDVENISAFSMYSEHCSHKYMSKGFFQFDLSQPVAHTYTIALQMLQVAVYAGFKEIYFIGIDNDFSGANMHFYKDSEKEKRNMLQWGLNPCPDNERAFFQAFHLLKKRGIYLYNAGVGGKLKALPRVDFQSLFSS